MRLFSGHWSPSLSSRRSSVLGSVLASHTDPARSHRAQDSLLKGREGGREEREEVHMCSNLSFKKLNADIGNSANIFVSSTSLLLPPNTLGTYMLTISDGIARKVHWRWGSRRLFHPKVCT